MGIIAEFKGDLLDVTQGDKVLNYSLDGILSDLFKGTPGHAEMAREYKTFLLVSGDKSSSRRGGELFRRYVNCLAHSPQRYFRMRDTDALCRFTIAVALACQDLDDVWFTDEQKLLFPQCAEWLVTDGEGHCDSCLYRSSYGAQATHRFGGVELCGSCKPQWREFLLSFPERAAKVFPELAATYNAAIVNVEAPVIKPVAA